MKLKQYLNEGKKTNIDLPKDIDKAETIIENLLTKNCKPFLSAIHGSPGFLYRGVSSEFMMMEIVPRKGRNPKDTPLEYHETLDRLFNKKFGWKPRTEGVFCSNGKSQAHVYGEVYTVWPLGKYKFIWSPEIHDLYLKIKREAKSWQVKLEPFQIQKLVDTYLKTNLKKAIESRNELMLSCSSYYLINELYSDFLKKFI